MTISIKNSVGISKEITDDIWRCKYLDKYLSEMINWARHKTAPTKLHFVPMDLSVNDIPIIRNSIATANAEDIANKISRYPDNARIIDNDRVTIRIDAYNMHTDIKIRPIKGDSKIDLALV